MARSTPPDTSTRRRRPRRPGAAATHSATWSGAMLSSMTTVAPAATASSTWSRRSHSTSTMRPGHRCRARSTASVIDSPAEVVVLHQHGLGQAAPVVVAAAGPDRRLLQGPEARGGLAGVEDPGGRVGRGHGVHVAPGERGHARQVAEEVERRPLGGEDRAQRAPRPWPPRHPGATGPRRDAPVHVDDRGRSGRRSRRRRPGRRPRRRPG